MQTKPRERIVEHVHGLAAGSLMVVALFLLTTGAYALYLLAEGQIGASALVYPLAFGALFVLGMREARLWHQHFRALTAGDPA